MLRFRSRDERWRRLYEDAVRSHAEELYAFAFRLSGCRDVAEDLVQETFYHAWKGLDSLRRKEAMRAWLFQILRHRHAHWRRDQAATHAALNKLFAEQPATESRADPALRLAEQDSIQKALNSLDDHYRLPILMVCVEGLTCRETAEQLDLPLGTVLSRLHRARARIEEALRHDERHSDSRPSSRKLPDHPSLRLGGGS